MEQKKTSSTEIKIISRVVGLPRNNDELPLIRRNKPLFAEYHRAQSDLELNQMFAVNQPIIDQMLADTVRQVEVDIAIQYCQKHYPDFQLHQPKEQTAVDFETNPDGSKYIIFYPKDGDKTVCYQKYILKN